MAGPSSDEECLAFRAAQGAIEPAPDGLAAALSAVIDAAAEACPGVAIDRVQLAAFLGRRIPSDVDAVEALGNRAVEDLALACACLAGDKAALRQFEETYMANLAGLLVKQGFGPNLVEEALQALRVSLFTGERPLLQAFGGVGSLKAWLRVTALRETVRAQRKERVMDADDILEALVDGAADPALRYQRKLYQDEFRAAFEEAIAGLSVRERNLLRQCVIYGATVDDLGSLYNVHRATVARWVALARQRLADDTKQRMLERLRIQPADYDSILNLIHSQLHVSIERVLGESSGGPGSLPDPT
jgi:RNA polymerase sigma-70 factor (ECF subfamily)